MLVEIILIRRDNFAFINKFIPNIPFLESTTRTFPIANLQVTQYEGNYFLYAPNAMKRWVEMRVEICTSTTSGL